MWYFAWLLGLPLAALLAVLNALWLELRQDSATIDSLLADHEGDRPAPAPTRPAPARPPGPASRG